MNPQFIPKQTILAALTTVGSAGVALSSAPVQAFELINLTTVNVFGNFFPTSTGVATLPTTAAAQGGFHLGPSMAASGVKRFSGQGGYVSMLTTGAGLAGIVAITGGSFM